MRHEASRRLQKPHVQLAAKSQQQVKSRGLVRREAGWFIFQEESKKEKPQASCDRQEAWGSFTTAARSGGRAVKPILFYVGDRSSPQSPPAASRDVIGSIFATTC
jgi:hypothetical protein